MQLKRYVGTPSAPADPSTIESAGNALVDTAVTSSGCSTPLIVLNELAGAYVQSPWPADNAQYRANVLALLQTIAARGAHPYLLVPGNEGKARAPYVGGEAADWWRQAAQFADLVREVHFNARSVRSRGPVVASRIRRRAMRSAIATFASLGIPHRAHRPRDRLPVGRRQGRSRGSAATREVVRHGEARDPCGATGRGGAADRLDLVLGLGDVRPRHRGSRQGSRCLRLPLDARSEPVRRPRDGRSGFRQLAHRGPDRPTTWRSVRMERRLDCARRGRPAGARDGRPPARARCPLDRSRAGAGVRAAGPGGRRARSRRHHRERVRRRRERLRGGARRRGVGRRHGGDPDREPARSPGCHRPAARPGRGNDARSVDG